MANTPALRDTMINPRIYMICPRTILVPLIAVETDGSSPYGNKSFSCGRMAAHVAHASGALAAQGIDTVSTDLIILQVPTSVELRKTAAWIRSVNRCYIEYKDPDFSQETSVIAMHPVEKDDPALVCLRFLPSWFCACDEKGKEKSEVPPEANDRNPARLFVVPKQGSWAQQLVSGAEETLKKD